MSILLRVERKSGGVPIELGNGQITGFGYTNTSPMDFLAKADNVVHSIQIRGEIPLRLLPPVEPNADHSNTLYAWALTEYRPDNDYYRTVTVRIIRHEKTIREIEFTYAYVQVYQEQVNSMKGVLEFELVIKQRRDQLDSIRFGLVKFMKQGSPKVKKDHVTILSSTSKIDKSQNLYAYVSNNSANLVDLGGHGIRRDLNQMAYYNKFLDESLGNQQWAQGMLDSGTYFIDTDNYAQGVYLNFQDLSKRGIDPSKVRDVNAPGINILTNPFVSLEQLEQIGFENVNFDMAVDLNMTLLKYDITTTDRIRHFLAQTYVESNHGSRLTEMYNDPEEEYFSQYDSRNGNSKPGDGSKFRGAGYIQITGRDVYQKFADFIDDRKIVEEGYSYVAEHYAWEAAGYFWSHYKKINPTADKGAEVLLTVSIKVNGKNKKGLPNGWKDRQDAYKRVSEIIN
ncbi:glycoside hydrolase family 19 protein [Paenibacillus elgii]|uniref:glycoside hydrolase family 19 protein n=1 Tax=Paenibacillus elgii TaxID=189691 RepID=UPI000248DAF2|nr:hypothetical protein [Paenibacillus elgii]